MDNVNLRLLNQATAAYAAWNMKATTEVFPEGSSDAGKMQLLVDEEFLDGIIEPKQSDAAYLFSQTYGQWYLSSEGLDILFQSSFDDGTGITSLVAGWSVVDGKLVHTGNGESRATFDGSDGSDYTINLTGVYISGASGQSGYGIYYRATNTEDISGYCFQFDPGAGKRFTVRKVVDGKEQGTLQVVSMINAMGSDFDMNAAHDIQIVASGNQQIISVDGVEIFNFTDSTFTEGVVGVRTWNNTRVEIDDVTIVKN